MSGTTDSSLVSAKRGWKRFQRINGGVLVGLVIVGFFLVMLILLPEAWPIFLLLLGIGASIAFWMESREAQGYPNKLDTEHTDVEANGRPMMFGPDLQIQSKATISSHPVGLVLIVGLGLVLLGRVPLFLPFLLGAVVLGTLLGLILWWKHR
ncbi:MAG TPA: hypothetical protein VGQ11_13930 [Candidatus Acidoferrales bacterium]|jgi:hypothetical protein|nr:hypothetical protein [Candidatus Acidoferrales bacterium]